MMRPVNILIAVSALALLASCRINLARIIEVSSIDLDETYDTMLLQTKGADTVLILRSSDCRSDSQDELVIVYKKKGLTYSRAVTTWGRRNIEPQLYNFKWDTIYSSLDRIKTEEPIPSYYATVIEGDTTWSPVLSLSGEQAWTFQLITNKDTVEWETTASERVANPSMAMTKVSDHIFSQTIHGTFGLTSFSHYGNVAYKRMPIISRRRR